MGVTAATIGLVVTGAAAPTGTNVSATDYKVVFTPLQATVTALAAASNVEVSWLQPIQATTYSGLRRYSKDEKVKAYTANATTAGTRDACTAACLLNASAAGAVALTGAAALATGAAAVAVASLAF